MDFDQMNPSETSRHNYLDDLQALLTGTLVVAVGLVFIKSAGLLTGGTTGLAFLIHYTTGLNFGLVLFLANLPFYFLAFMRMGWEFTLKTVITVLMVSLLTEGLPYVISIESINPYFGAVGGGLLMGVGMLILFRHRASLGGFNILVLYLQERFGLRAGKMQMVLDCTILTAAMWILPPGLLIASVLGAILLNFALAVNHKPGRYTAF
ncbi:MAG: YitT family protein [Gammaproteobacteria bacterium]|nr:YitT family protein [Gammaproteobacteria bacterium]